MEYGLLLQHISKHIQISEDQEKYLLSLLRSGKLRRKQFLFQEGDVNKNAVAKCDGVPNRRWIYS